MGEILRVNVASAAAVTRSCVPVACNSVGWAFCGTENRDLVDLTELRGPAAVAHCKLPVVHKPSQTENF